MKRLFLIIVFGLLLIDFTVLRIKNENAIVAKKAEVDAQNIVETAQQQSNYFRQFVEDKKFPQIVRSFETNFTDNHGLTFTCQYSISYINANCLLITKHDWPFAKETAEFRILRNDDQIYKWIATYKKWCQIALTNHLADWVTNNISKCCLGYTHGVLFPIEQINKDCFSDVDFVTPNYLIIGDGLWSKDDVTNLEKLLSMIPALDADLKEAIAQKAKGENDLINQNQKRLNEENRAKALLQ